MSAVCHSFSLSSPADSAAFAVRLGRILAPGDTVLISGPIGAGKTHICRHLIQSILLISEDVPSPTFTLVQTYETTAGELWHADLYRLGGPDEIAELGLSEAFDSAICLVEWPDRLGADAPPAALSLDIRPDPGDTGVRHLTLTWSDPKWRSRLDTLAND